MVKAEKNEQSAFMENTVALNTVAAVTYLSSVSYFEMHFLHNLHLLLQEKCA